MFSGLSAQAAEHESRITTHVSPVTFHSPSLCYNPLLQISLETLYVH